MILEYLFSDPKSVQKDIRAYAEENVSVKIKDINKSEIWLVNIKVNLEQNKSALTLSKINEEITEKYDVATLTNEPAAYYNKKLYPLINKFERDLRKLLYLASKLSENASELEAIKDLEERDFGSLFDLIFTDEKFINSVKSTINKKTWNYSKEEIINSLKEIEEDNLWKKLLSEEIAPVLQKNYIRIKNYRNSVMHAHNITTEVYSNAKSLYSTVTGELEKAIDNIVNNKINFNNIQNFNSTLLEALYNEKMNNFINIKDVYKDVYDEQLRNTLDTPAMNALKVQADLLQNSMNTPAMNALKVQLDQIQKTIYALKKQVE